MDNPEVLIVIFGGLFSIATTIIGFFTVRADRRSKQAVKRAEQAHEDLADEKELALQREKLNADANQALIDNLTRELERQAKARETQDLAHSAQITRFDGLVTDLTTKVGGLEAEKETLNQRIDGMVRLYKDESEQWGSERDKMTKRIDTQETQIKGLVDHNISLLRELEAVKQQAEELTQERENLLAEIERQDARILVLETARSDGDVPQVTGEPQ